MRAFKISFSVLHDADSPQRTDGKKNGMWAENQKIYEAIHKCRDEGIRVVHRISVPDFERRFEMPEGDKHKPLRIWQILNTDTEKGERANELLKDLIGSKSAHCQFAGQQFEVKLVEAVKGWATAHAKNDVRFAFE